MSYTPSAVAPTTVKWGSPLVEINGVLEFTFSGGDRPTIDVTPISSVDAVTVLGRKTPTSAAMRLAWDPADTQHIALLAASTGVATFAFKLTLSDPGTADLTFTARVANFQPTLDSGDAALVVSVPLVLTGGLTVTP